MRLLLLFVVDVLALVVVGVDIAAGANVVAVADVDFRHPVAASRPVSRHLAA